LILDRAQGAHKHSSSALTCNSTRSFRNCVSPQKPLVSDNRQEREVLEELHANPLYFIY